MRTIHCRDITDTVALLAEESNFYLPHDVEKAIGECLVEEESPLGKEVLGILLENARIAREEKIPICQDCGFTVIFIEVGQDLRIEGGGLAEAIEEGVRRGYTSAYLRKSIVKDPLFERRNTKDNTPPVIHMEIVPGDKLRVIVAPKGGGSENMSALAMLKPSQGLNGVKDFVLEAVERAGSNPCPPVVVGIGIGGTAEKAMLLAKKAIMRNLGSSHPDPRFAEFERDLLAEINALGIGPEGFGGRSTALGVQIETFPCHIASLPVAVNLQCHAARHREAVI
jgi:fumarate hydratase subunit alpha